MKRTLLLNLLNQYQPTLPEEMESKKRIITFVNENPLCFERSLEIGHITGSAWLLNQPKTHALLMLHAKLNRWVQLGGHCDGNHDVLATAIKEAQEESGMQSIVPLTPSIFDIDIHLIPASKKEEAHYHYDIRFLLHVNSNEQIIQNTESKELRWIRKNYNDLPTDSPSITRMFDKWAKITS